MSRNSRSALQLPTEIQDESVATTLKVIMDVLKSHEGSIKELRHWLEFQRSSPTKEPLHSNGLIVSGLEKPVKDVDEISDNQSEVSSITSNRTEYHELPTRSTLINSTGMLTSANGNSSYADFSRDKTPVLSVNGLTSTPSKSSPSSGNPSPGKTSSYERTPKLDLSVSTIQNRDYQAKPGTAAEIHKFSQSLQSGNYSVSVLNNKIQLLENQISEWGDIIDEMSDRMANQPSLIRKFAKESITDKVSYRQHTEDLETLERKLLNRINDKFAGLDRKIVELYDDMMSQVSNLSTLRGADTKKKAKQDTTEKLNAKVDLLTDQFDEQKEKLKDMSKGMSDLDDKVTHFKQDMTLYKRHFENKRSDEEDSLNQNMSRPYDLVSLVAEQLLGNEEIVGWKLALKEIHAALNKQSEINTSLHHSYATLDKRSDAMRQKVPLHGRWRWSGVSNLYPKAHSCVADQQTDDISFTSQTQNPEPRNFVWEKSKPYVVVTTAGCYWVAIGAFSKKTGTPPSLQLTVDEEPVPLYNSSGKSPSHHRISVISSAPKSQPSPGKFKSEGVAPWRPGSSLLGAIIIPAHSRIGISPTSTAPGTRVSVEGYMELVKIY